MNQHSFKDFMHTNECRVVNLFTYFIRSSHIAKYSTFVIGKIRIKHQVDLSATPFEEDVVLPQQFLFQS